MNRVFVLGAGFSKCYRQSKTHVQMPLARDFFPTFNKLDISTNLWVKVGRIVNYVRNTRGIAPEQFSSFNEDIELLHSEIEDKLRASLQDKEGPDSLLLLGLYNEVIFLFASVLNEIQNGPVSPTHVRLAGKLTSEDTIITFNWDTLMDRALATSKGWNPDTGYYIHPKKIYRNGWVDPDECTEMSWPYLLKLHGSSNWLTGATVFDEQRNIVHSHSSTPDTVYLYESTIDPYDCYDGRYMPGYEPYSYGYYPPNLPDKGRTLPEGCISARFILRDPFTPKGKYGESGIMSMPLIIPPVKHKSYDFFGTLFRQIWDLASMRIQTADEIHLYGYSFPSTDHQSDELFRRAFTKRTTIPDIVIINPHYQRIHDKFQIELGIPNIKIRAFSDYIDEDFNFDRVI